ncbi:hypothetical protein BJY52DRAFT_1350674 [Lactarius psammicola]|nr:hypothetical protein BJY52DRAFT_1350674 [Lactarius psammicola]
MRHDHRDVPGGDRERGSSSEILGSIGRDSESQGGVLRRGTSDAFTQRLGVAASRALERRLGVPPSQADVCKVVNTLTSRSSRFLRYAEHAQARLARLHLELQKSQEQQSHIDTTQEITASLIESGKRPLEEPNDKLCDPPREVKRACIESSNPNPHKSPPSFNPKDAGRAPSLPMVQKQKHAPIAPQGTLTDPQFAESSCVDSADPHARVDDPTTTQTPVTGQGQLAPTDLSKSNSDREIEQQTPSHNIADAASHGNCGHIESVSQPTRRKSLPADPFATRTPTQETPGMAPPPSTETSTSGAQQSPLTVLSTQDQNVVGSRTDLSPNSPASLGVGLPACTRQQAPPSAPAPPFIANVLGIWAIQVGKPSICQIDLSFEVNQDTLGCIRHWATRRQGFDPSIGHVVVHLVALHATAVSAAQQVLSQSQGNMTPQAFALALHDLQPQWPDDGTLVLQMNADQPGEQSWFAYDMSAGKSLDVSSAVLLGTNTLRILQLRNMAELVFVLYATPPTAEMLAAAIESERQRKIYSFRRPHLERLLG